MGAKDSKPEEHVVPDPILFHCPERLCIQEAISCRIYNIDTGEYETIVPFGRDEVNMLSLKNDMILVATYNQRMHICNKNFDVSTSKNFMSPFTCIHPRNHIVFKEDDKLLTLLSFNPNNTNGFYIKSEVLCTLLEIDKQSELTKVCKISSKIKSEFSIIWYLCTNELFVICVGTLYMNYTMSTTDGKQWILRTHDHLLRPMSNVINYSYYKEKNIILVESTYGYEIIEMSGKTTTIFTKGVIKQYVSVMYDECNNTIIQLFPASWMNSCVCISVFSLTKTNQIDSILKENLIRGIDIQTEMKSFCTRRYIILQNQNTYIIDKQTLELKTKIPNVTSAYFYWSVSWIEEAIDTLKQFKILEKFSSDLLRIIAEYIS
jgi:hypothetical protein